MCTQHLCTVQEDIVIIVIIMGNRLSRSSKNKTSEKADRSVAEEKEVAATSRPVQSQQQQQLDQSPVKRDTGTDRGDTKEETPSAKETTNGNDKTEDTTKGGGVSRCGPSGLTLEHYMFPFENVVFEGGGSKCLAYCGAVRVSGTFKWNQGH